MNNLVALQQAFQASLLNQESHHLQKLVVKTKQPSAKQRINIYANAYSLRLIEALSDNYSQLSAYIGQKKFDKIAQIYLAKYPSNFRLIQFFGDKLSGFLQEYYPQKPVWAELAKFEWAIGHTFDATDVVTANIDYLKKIPTNLWPNIEFIFHPSVSINNFNYNIVNLWNSLLNKNAQKAIKHKSGKSVIFWRHNLETFYRQMPELETEVITIAITGGSFAQICEVLSRHDNKNAATVAVTLLIQWLNAGLICKINKG